MPPVTSPHNEPPQTNQPASCRPMCPVCSGVMIDLRGTLRCSRCYFSICEGCEGGVVGGFSGADD
jgi:hypothetical protein